MISWILGPIENVRWRRRLMVLMVACSPITVFGFVGSFITGEVIGGILAAALTYGITVVLAVRVALASTSDTYLVQRSARAPNNTSRPRKPLVRWVEILALVLVSFLISATFWAYVHPTIIPMVVSTIVLTLIGRAVLERRFRR